MRDKTKALAITLKVNGKDLECLIKSVFNEMVKDGLGEYYLSATKKEQVEIIQAYVSNARDKYSKFSEAYQLSEHKKRSFNNTIYLMAKGAKHEH